MKQKELCQWLRDNSAGTYRPSAEAADEIERLQAAWDSAFRQANENGGRAVLLGLEVERLRSAVDLALFHLRRNDHATPPDGERCTRAMIRALEDALTPNA